ATSVLAPGGLWGVGLARVQGRAKAASAGGSEGEFLLAVVSATLLATAKPPIGAARKQG
ncbi:MAG: hypothetical protein RLZZ274_927, partial [Cyanobacteriota bacterium]